MYRERCRPKYTPEQLKEIYSKPWKMNENWKDHKLRLEKTIEVSDYIIGADDRTAADLSCGDAYVASRYSRMLWHLGDFAEGYAFTGPIEETIDLIPPVDVFFLCETLEHLDDPDYVLRKIRTKTNKLILSTPVCLWHDENPQHYWSWDQSTVKGMLKAAKFRPVRYAETERLMEGDSYYGYVFQIWGCL